MPLTLCFCLLSFRERYLSEARFPRSAFTGNWVAENYGVTYMTALPDPASCYAPRDAPVTPGLYRGFYEQEPTTGEGVPSQCHRRPGLSRLWAESQFWNQGGDDYAGVRGRRDRGHGAAAGAAARGPWPRGDGYDDGPGQVGLAGAAGRRCCRDGRAGCGVSR